MVFPTQCVTGIASGTYNHDSTAFEVRLIDRTASILARERERGIIVKPTKPWNNTIHPAAPGITRAF